MVNTVVVAHKTQAAYPEKEPFHPERGYPEYPFSQELTQERNDVYAMVRDVFREMELDAGYFGTPQWNPLGTFIKPGMTVVLKPNLVQDRHYRGGDMDCLITHGSMVRAVMDYVYIALHGSGKVIMGDAPVLSTVFDKAVEKARLNEVIAFYKEQKLPGFEVFDFRKVVGRLDDRFHVTGWDECRGDPHGTVQFDLGSDSMLEPIAKYAKLFRLPHYRVGDTEQYHSSSYNKFVVARSVIDAQVVINMPKMKTHCKAGMTGALKNFVGMVAVRHCYTNYRKGSPEHHGDEYPYPSAIKTISDAIERKVDGLQAGPARSLLTLAHRVNERIRNMLGIDGIRDGAWSGNDTVWRAIVDLVRIARYGKTDGTMSSDPQRILFTIMDGIIAGEGEGPLESQSIHANCLIAGVDPIAVDAVTSKLMGFDFRKVPVIKNGAELTTWPLLDGKLDEITCRINGSETNINNVNGILECGPFKPARGWIGRIEEERR